MATSRASALEGRAWLGPGALSWQPGQPYRQLGAGAQLGLDLSLGSRFGVELGVEAAALRAPLERQSALISGAFLGARYHIDAFEYVPYLAVDAVAFAPRAVQLGDPSAPGATARWGSRLTLGLFWRPRRTWSIGGHLDLTGSIPDFGLSSALWLDFGYHWRL